MINAPTESPTAEEKAQILKDARETLDKFAPMLHSENAIEAQTADIVVMMTLSFVDSFVGRDEVSELINEYDLASQGWAIKQIRENLENDARNLIDTTATIRTELTQLAEMCGRALLYVDKEVVSADTEIDVEKQSFTITALDVNGKERLYSVADVTAFDQHVERAATPILDNNKEYKDQLYLVCVAIESVLEQTCRMS